MRMRVSVLLALAVTVLIGLLVVPTTSMPQKSPTKQQAASPYGSQTPSEPLPTRETPPNPPGHTDTPGQQSPVPQRPWNEYGHLLTPSPLMMEVQRGGCDGYGPYPFLREDSSPSSASLSDKPDLLGISEAMKRLEGYETTLRSWCREFDRALAPAEIDRKIDAAWRDAGGGGPTPPKVRKNMEFLVDEYFVKPAHKEIGEHVGLLRLLYNGRDEEPPGPSPTRAMTAAGLDKIRDGMKKLPDIEAVRSRVDGAIEVWIKLEWWFPQGKDDAVRRGDDWAKEQDKLMKSQNLFNQSLPALPLLDGRRLFSGPEYVKIPSGGKIFLYAVCADGLQAIDKLYVGVPTLVEVQLKTDYGKSEYQFELSAGGVPLKLNAHAIDQHGRIFRTDPFVPVPLKADIGPVFNPSNGPQR